MCFRVRQLVDSFASMIMLAGELMWVVLALVLLAGASCMEVVFWL
jgi:hypothetical protein